MATYYVKNGGNDVSAGTSDGTAWAHHPWMSGWTAAPKTLVAGDIVCLKCGSVWYDTITPTVSGTVGNVIMTTSYDTGDQPKISGFTTITGWSTYSTSVKYKDIACDGNVCNLVTVNGINTGMGRYPHTGWNTYETHSDNVSITDSSLTGSPNWTGAELVMRRSKWMTDRSLITNHTTNTITFTAVSSWGPTDNYGYFFQNSLQTLSTGTPVLGEWYYNGSRFYMYFGVGVDETSYTVKVTTRNRFLYISSKNYLTFDNICFEGSNTSAIENRNGQNIIIQNCSFYFLGTSAIYIDNDYSSNASMTVDNNLVDTSNCNAFQFLGSTNTVWIKNNTISNIGLIIGSAYLSTDTVDEVDYIYDGITISGTNSIIEYNTLSNIGHSGIRMTNGNNIIARYNYITNWGTNRYDSGGIYTYGGLTATRTIYKNICVNSNQTVSGVSIDGPNTLSIHGIYIDNDVTNCNISYNICANCYSAGIDVTCSGHNNIQHNTCYNNNNQLRFWYGGYGQPITATNVDHNIFFSKESTQLAFYYADGTGGFLSVGTLDYNYYARPIDDYPGVDADTIRTYDNPVTINYTLSEWKTYSSQDSNSNKAPVQVTDTTNELHFIYNETGANKYYILSAPMVDVANTPYSGTITLAPWGSLILLGLGTVTLTGLPGGISIVIVRPHIHAWYPFPTVTIGSQVWMARNWDWKTGTFPSGDEDNVNDYGGLYTWDQANAIATANPGWHLPTTGDLSILITLYGGFSIVGGHMKTIGTTYWDAPNLGADNSSGFGARGSGSNESNFRTDFLFWGTSTGVTTAWATLLTKDSEALTTTTHLKTDRASVRLIKD